MDSFESGDFGIGSGLKDALARIDAEAEMRFLCEPSLIADNSGAFHGDEISPWEPMSELDRDPQDHHANIVRLMRPTHCDRAHKPANSGGGGSSGGAKKATPIRRGIVTVDDSAVEKWDTPRFKVTGLSAGERNYYEQRPGLARDILREAIGQIVREELQAEWPRVLEVVGKQRFDFYVWGLAEYEVAILRVHRGSARKSLAEHARLRDGARVFAIDRGADRMMVAV